MRGCFFNLVRRGKRHDAFPAYAGMFPRGGSQSEMSGSFPRVCGDVSSALQADAGLKRLSPRMRGCFFLRLIFLDRSLAFPAYAGMFPRLDSMYPRVRSFPRVCGDVSVRADLTYQQGLLSPRMRGCFLSCNSDARRFPAFPAYAGMFLIPERLILNIRGFPRVCGDVSWTDKVLFKETALSPRMRGCFLEITRATSSF